MAERNQLGSLLVDRGLVSRDQLGAALEEQSRSRKSLGRILVEQGMLSETDLVALPSQRPARLVFGAKPFRKPKTMSHPIGWRWE